MAFAMSAAAMLLFQTAVRAEGNNGDLGKVEYHLRCASCHGSDGKGDGPVADQLKTPPADLTELAKKNGGVFPLSAVYEKIDGRQEVKAHGPRDMPVWGYLYLPSALNQKQPQSWLFLDTRILALADYLYRIQEK